MDFSSVTKVHIKTMADLDRLFSRLSKEKVFSFDTETSGKDKFSRLNYALLQPFGISFYHRGCAYWMEREMFDRPISRKNCLATLQKIFSLPIIKIAHNAPFDVNVLYKLGVKISEPIWDSRGMAALYDERDMEPTEKFKLKPLLKKYLGFEYEELDFKKSDISEYPFETRFEYACNDVIGTFHLAEFYYPGIKKQDLMRVFQIENSIIPVIAVMQRMGIDIDVGYLKKQKSKLIVRIGEIKEEIYELAGEEFNLNSPQQKAAILYEKLKLPIKGKTKGGVKGKKRPSTDKKTLAQINDIHPIVPAILKYQFLEKFSTTYLNRFLNDVVDGKLYGKLDPAGARSGRFSSSAPNLQNLIKEQKDDPSQDPEKIFWSRVIKHSVCAPKGYVLLCADYSQIEFRFAVHLSECLSLIKAYRRGDCDIHKETAAMILGKPVPQVTDAERYAAKAINFGTIYGQTIFGLAKTLGISKEKAEEYQRQYFKKVPEIREWMRETISKARKTGFVRSMSGRKRRLSYINSEDDTLRTHDERTAVNHPPQGGATGDLNKMALRTIWDDIQSGELGRLAKKVGKEIYPILDVHDEIVLCAPKEISKKVMERQKFLMENVVKLRVPLVVDCKITERWSEKG